MSVNNCLVFICDQAHQHEVLQTPVHFIQLVHLLAISLTVSHRYRLQLVLIVTWS
jgi:hypothetical protein